MRELDPNAIMMILGGIPIQGVSDGTFVKVSMTERAFSLHKGEQDDGTRIRNRKSHGSIEFTLGAQSPTNARLAALHASDLLRGDGVVPFLIRDLKGTSLFSGDEAFIEGMPDWERSGQHTPVTWVVLVNKLKGFVGGSLT